MCGDIGNRKWSVSIVILPSFIQFPISFHLLQQSGETFEVARVGIYIKYLSVAVDEFVGGPAVDLQEMLYGTLLVGGQVVVDDVLARDVVLLDDILPRFVAAAIG